MAFAAILIPAPIISAVGDEFHPTLVAGLFFVKNCAPVQQRNGFIGAHVPWYPQIGIFSENVCGGAAQRLIMDPIFYAVCGKNIKYPVADHLRQKGLCGKT